MQSQYIVIQNAHPCSGQTQVSGFLHRLDSGAIELLLRLIQMDVPTAKFGFHQFLAALYHTIAFLVVGNQKQLVLTSNMDNS